jgi:hypothetical protein
VGSGPEASLEATRGGVADAVRFPPEGASRMTGAGMPSGVATAGRIIRFDSPDREGGGGTGLTCATAGVDAGVAGADTAGGGSGAGVTRGDKGASESTVDSGGVTCATAGGDGSTGSGAATVGSGGKD